MCLSLPKQFLRLIAKATIPTNKNIIQTDSTGTKVTVKSAADLTGCSADANLESNFCLSSSDTISFSMILFLGSSGGSGGIGAIWVFCTSG